ncbi:hypothetical protein BC835DRAFT_1468150 [Cytidiella melzeri]|nr:hypothetical protein BC835DRAFT_1468150 [Cytidiella melzeri]
MHRVLTDYTAADGLKWERYADHTRAFHAGKAPHPGPPPEGYVDVYKGLKQKYAPLPEDVPSLCYPRATIPPPAVQMSETAYHAMIDANTRLSDNYMAMAREIKELAVMNMGPNSRKPTHPHDVHQIGKGRGGRMEPYHQGNFRKEMGTRFQKPSNHSFRNSGFANHGGHRSHGVPRDSVGKGTLAARLDNPTISKGHDDQQLSRVAKRRSQRRRKEKSMADKVKGGEKIIPAIEKVLTDVLQEIPKPVKQTTSKDIPKNLTQSSSMKRNPFMKKNQFLSDLTSSQMKMGDRYLETMRWRDEVSVACNTWRANVTGDRPSSASQTKQGRFPRHKEWPQHKRLGCKVTQSEVKEKPRHRSTQQ